MILVQKSPSSSLGGSTSKSITYNLFCRWFFLLRGLLRGWNL